MPSHISPDQLMAVALGQTALAEADVSHLAGCAECRQQVEAMTLLLHELKVARASTPSAAATARYVDAFHAMPRRGQSPLGALGRWIMAQLSFDSRVAPLAAGIRSGRAGSYRMLFSSERADLELMVEDDGGMRRLEGEYMEVAAESALPVLVQLQARTTGGLAAEAESDDAGRFWLTGIEPGQYALILTDQVGGVMEVRTLEIT